MLNNYVNIQVKSAKGELLDEYTGHNDYSDDVLVNNRCILTNFNQGSAPYCFILPDGANWTGYTFNRRDPYAPYAATLNRSMDANADPLYAGRQSSTWVNNTWKLFYRWSKLPLDFSLKALGLTSWETNTLVDGINDAPTIFVPLTLVVLPTAIPIKGRLGGAQTPDILEVSYYLSIVGVS